MDIRLQIYNILFRRVRVNRGITNDRNIHITRRDVPGYGHMPMSVHVGKGYIEARTLNSFLFDIHMQRAYAD